MNLFHKLADLLEKTADHLDTVQTPVAVAAPAPVVKQASAPKNAEYLSEVYQSVTGQVPDQALLDKLSTDQSMLDTFLKLAEHAAGADSLGGPADKDDQPLEPKTAAEKVKQAEDRFGAWILNG